MKFSIFFLLLLPVSADGLHYVINWPSGLSLGEATLNLDAQKAADESKSAMEWSSDFEIVASLPGFAITDHYHSTAEGKDMCSVKLDKTVRRGEHKSEETDTFHQDTHTVTRETHVTGGGKSDVDVSDCARDALTFLNFARHEMAEGRPVPRQSVVLGGVYEVRLDGMGEQTIKVGGKPVDTDRVQATIKGAASSFSVEIFFTRDQARTPVLISIPLELGKFTAELIH
jgi:hypothetical protein